MKNYYFLDYDNASFVNDKFIPYACVPDWWFLYKVDTSVLSTQALNYLDLIKVSPFKKFNFFVGNPNAKSDIHLDGKDTSYAINYSWGSSNSIMRWFSTKDAGRPTQTSAATPYINFKNCKMDLIEQVSVPNNKLILVRIDIPHDVINYSDNPRYCISIRGNPKLEWSEAVQYFSKHISS